MNQIIDGILKAFQLMLSGDPTLYSAVYRSLLFSGLATVIAMLWGTPIAMLLTMKDFRGRWIFRGFFTALIGMPTVALGVILWLAFSRAGPLGFLEILYTPAAIIIGEAVLVTPLIVSIASTAIESVDPEIFLLAKTLGASDSQASVVLLKEAANGVVFSNVAGFNRAIAELGVAWLVGGNLAGLTDVLTTDISMYTNRGDPTSIAYAIAFAVVLMIIVFGISLTMFLARNPRVLTILGRSPQ